MFGKRAALVEKKELSSSALRGEKGAITITIINIMIIITGRGASCGFPSFVGHNKLTIDNHRPQLLASCKAFLFGQRSTRLRGHKDWTSGGQTCLAPEDT